jgi:PAS domain S-box-containing protein
MAATGLPHLQLPPAAADRPWRALQELLERAAVPVQWLASDGTVIEANRAMLDLLGYEPEAYVGHHLVEFHLPGLALDTLLGRLATGEPVRDLAARVRARDGSVKEVRLDTGASWESGGQRRTCCVSRDATVQRGWDDRPSQGTVPPMQQAAHDLVWDWDLLGRRVVWTGSTSPFFGRGPGDTSETDYDLWASRVHPDDLGMTEAVARAALASGAEHWEHEYRFRLADGGWARMLERAYISRDERGEALRVVGAMQDVTRRRDIEEATTRLAAIVASSSDAIIGKTLDGIVTSWNAAAERIFGYTEAEMVGRPIFSLIPESRHGAERELLARIRQGELVELGDVERIRKDGVPVPVALAVSPIRDSAGTVIGASSIMREITERKRAAEELARREERYRALVTATTSIVWTTDSDGRFAEPQTSWQEYTGQSWEDHRGLGWANALHGDDREEILAGWHQARVGRTVYETEGRVWCEPHQGYRHFVARFVPVTGTDGAIREWVGMVTDVEDRWLVEERLRHVERMESVGRLAGGVAHEANNQMTVVLGTTALLQRRVHSSEVLADLELIKRAAERTAAVTQQLLAFSRRQLLQPQVVDLNAVVLTLEPVLRRALGETSRLVHRLAPDLGQILADPGQLDQVLLNLTLNARDAMPDGGTVTIETANVLVDHAFSAKRPTEAITPGPYARITVSDTGEGIAPDSLDHVFEPFFTTKGVGQGTGLGLSTVYGIVKQSGGFVTVSSVPGQGAAFDIYLPLTSVVTPGGASAPPPPAKGESELVLVVEDDAGVRGIVGRTLREQGYEVLEAASGPEALELADRRPFRPGLVIADVVMPGMSGGQLAVQLAERWTDVPVLFMSGYTGFDAVSWGFLESGRDFMPKPLDPDELARKVREILAAARERAADGG